MARHCISLNFTVDSEKDEPSYAEIREQLDHILACSSEQDLNTDMLTVELFDRIDDE